jgi:3-isopropylmalate/(R)-2-methylmalate dehydratase large subunit
VTSKWLQSVGVAADAIELAAWQGDAGAPTHARHELDATQLQPQVAAPDSPANAADVDNFATQAINIAYIGACTGAKLEDLRMAAQILRGRRVAKGVNLMVAPASRRDEDTARREGTLELLLSAGAKLLPNACNVCAGYGADRFDEHAVVISSTARNFKGRMGHPDAKVFLGSPWTVAASAVAGRITDPRDLLARGERP